MPLFLTMILFFGPICMHICNGMFQIYMEPMYWVNSVQNLIWLRNHLVAPLSEEFTFRSCMLPLLLQCFNPSTAIILCPFFFGSAHFHHMTERMSQGLDFKTAFFISCKLFIIHGKLYLSNLHYGSTVIPSLQTPGILMQYMLCVTYSRFPIHVHNNIRCILGISILQNRPFRCLLYSARILQSHGISRSKWIVNV